MKKHYRWDTSAKDREWVFIQTAGIKDFGVAMKGIAKCLKHPAEGGLIEEGISVGLPDGKVFFALSFRGSLDRWRSAVLKYCAESERLTAIPKDGKIITSESKEFNLTALTIQQY